MVLISLGPLDFLFLCGTRDLHKVLLMDTTTCWRVHTLQIRGWYVVEERDLVRRPSGPLSIGDFLLTLKAAQSTTRQIQYNKDIFVLVVCVVQTLGGLVVVMHVSAHLFLSCLKPINWDFARGLLSGLV
jgi:hypothetical protein